MKYWTLILLVAVPLNADIKFRQIKDTDPVYIMPNNAPMFKGMIMRCADDGQCHWECEFGVETSTEMVKDNLILKSSGCKPKPEEPKSTGIIYSPLNYGDTVQHYGISW